MTMTGLYRAVTTNSKNVLILVIYISFLSGFGQKTQISVQMKSLTSKRDFVYWKWENQFKISTDGIFLKDLIISVTHGTISAVNDSIYSVAVSVDSTEVGFIFSGKGSGKTKLIGSQRRSVRAVEAIGITFDGKMIDGKTRFAKADLKVGKTFRVVLDKDLYISSLPLAYFEAVSDKGNMTVSGGKISEELKAKVLDDPGPGRSVFIEGCYFSGYGRKICSSGKMLIK